MKRTSIGHLAIIAGVALAALGINHFVYFLSPLFLSLLIGIAAANLLHFSAPFNSTLSLVSKKAMRVGISLLGLQITFHTFAEIGAKGFLAILLVVAVTFSVTRWMAIRLGFGTELATLMAGGFSICGASAIAAIGAARKSDKNEISYAIGLVTLLGTISIFALPPVTRLFHLHESTSGSWIGAAVHDVGQVVATASVVGGGAMKYAVITKLARVVLLAPLLVVLTPRHSGEVKKDLPLPKRVAGYFPPFIAAFLLLVVVNNSIHFSAHYESFFANVSKFLLSMGLFAMAASVKIGDLRKIGGKPLIFGVTAWICFGAFSLTVIRSLGI